MRPTTTMRPTTIRPTTMRPTMRPTTQPPTTQPPTTQPPTTQPPTTMRPTTQPPTTQPPTTQPPTTQSPTTQPPTTQPPTTSSPNVLGIASQYQVVGEGCTNCLYYSSWCSNVPNKICFGEYRLRFSNGVISPITIKTDAPLGLTDPDLRFKLSNIPSDGVTAILQVKNVATNSNDNNWYDANVPSQFIKPTDKKNISKKKDEGELTFKYNTAQPKKINKKENINCVSDRIPHSSSTADNHKYLGKFNSYEECVEKAEIPSNAKAITWHKPNGGDWDNTCFSINDNNTNVADNNTTCGVLS
jgi:hypothetical protein